MGRNRKNPTGARPHLRHSLRLRAALAVGLTAMVISTSLAAAAYLTMSSSLVDDREEAGTRQAFINARLLRARLDPPPQDVGELLAGLEAGPSGGSLLELRGQWYSSSLDLERSRLPSALRALVEQGEAGTQRINGPDGVELAVGVPVGTVDARYYEVTSFAETEAALTTMRTVLAVGALIATAVGAIVGVVLSGRILRPLREVAGVARRIVSGTTEVRLDASGDADLQPLTDAFNEMLDALDERVLREAAFASDVSHELRGPLTTLSAAVHVVNRRRDDLPADVVESVDALDDQVQAFNELVLDLLEISRFDAGTARLESRPIDLVRFCEEVIADRGLDVRVDTAGVDPTDADGAECPVDPRRLQQALANLLDNAERYAGGATRVGVVRDGDVVRIEVDDEGPGVPSAERESVFNRFVRGAVGRRAGSPSGTGLGLALSRRHIELHGGRLWVDDRPGGGARFVIELPVRSRAGAW